MNVAQGLELLKEYDALVKGAGNFTQDIADVDQEPGYMMDFQWEMLELAIDHKWVAYDMDDPKSYPTILLFGALANAYMQMARAELAS